jgi:membrane-associated phospholipid phosphatase
MTAPPQVRTRTDLVARFATEALAPAVLLASQLILVGWRATGSLGWGALAALFAVAIPYAFVVRGVRHGRYGDHHIPERTSRRTPLLVALGSGVVGLALLAATGAPRDIIALLISGAAGIAAFGIVNQWWKISLHAGIAAGTVAVLTLLYGAAALAGVPLVALVCWSRVRLRVHTIAQVVAGAILGALVAWLVFGTAR